MAVAERQTRSAVEVSGELKGGVFYVDDKRTMLAQIAKLVDGPAIMRIDPAGEVRAVIANNGLWAVYRDIATYLNENRSGQQTTSQKVHEFYKEKFNGGHSTTHLSPEQFSTYKLRVMAHAAQEYGVEFPDPEPL